MPCAPTNVSMVTDCTNNTALVSWSPSLGAVQYMVTAHSHQNNVSYRTSDLTCNLDTLTCGNSYTIQVAATDDSCSSVPSQVQMFNTGDTGTTRLRQPNTYFCSCGLLTKLCSLLAPCAPQNVSVNVSCPSNDISISWNAAGEADHFLVSVTPDNGGASKSCNTTNTACSISNVTCGNTFSVHVTSVGGSCHSQHSQAISIQSGMKASKASMQKPFHDA